VKVFNLPDLGEGLQEATIVEWHVASGGEVAADQAMVSVETDKAIVEIPAPHDGKVEKLFAQAGDKVHVGAPLVGFQGSLDDTGTIVGEIATEVKATPAVRALARSLNVELASVRSTGPGGVATSEDVKRAARGEVTPAKEKAPSGMRRVMAQNMALARREVALVTIHDDADIGLWPEAERVMARLARALVAACRAEPALNAWYDAKAEARTPRAEVDLGIAVDLPDGLLVPVLRNAQSISDLAAAIDELVKRARARSLSPEMLRGASITLSNFGAIGGRYATPLVVPPQVAILGAGRVARGVLPLSLSFDHRAATGGEAARFLNALRADLEK